MKHVKKVKSVEEYNSYITDKNTEFPNLAYIEDYDVLKHSDVVPKNLMPSPTTRTQFVNYDGKLPDLSNFSDCQSVVIDGVECIDKFGKSVTKEIQPVIEVTSWQPKMEERFYLNRTPNYFNGKIILSESLGTNDMLCVQYRYKSVDENGYIAWDRESYDLIDSYSNCLIPISETEIGLNSDISEDFTNMLNWDGRDITIYVIKNGKTLEGDPTSDDFIPVTIIFNGETKTSEFESFDENGNVIFTDDSYLLNRLYKVNAPTSGKIILSEPLGENDILFHCGRYPQWDENNNVYWDYYYQDLFDVDNIGYNALTKTSETEYALTDGFVEWINWDIYQYETDVTVFVLKNGKILEGDPQESDIVSATLVFGDETKTSEFESFDENGNVIFTDDSYILNKTWGGVDEPESETDLSNYSTYIKFDRQLTETDRVVYFDYYEWYGDSYSYSIMTEQEFMSEFQLEKIDDYTYVPVSGSTYFAEKINYYLDQGYDNGSGTFFAISEGGYYQDIENTYSNFISDNTKLIDTEILHRNIKVNVSELEPQAEVVPKDLWILGGTVIEELTLTLPANISLDNNTNLICCYDYNSGSYSRQFIPAENFTIVDGKYKLSQEYLDYINNNILQNYAIYTFEIERYDDSTGYYYDLVESFEYKAIDITFDGLLSLSKNVYNIDFIFRYPNDLHTKFYNNANLYSIEIPDYYNTIRGNTFGSGCYSLSNLKIPSTINLIEEKGGWNNLDNLYIDDIYSFLNIRFNAADSNPLQYCGNLYLDGQLVTDLVIRDYNGNIQNYAFYNVNSLNTIKFENCNINKIYNNSFSYCTSLTEITLGDGITSIDADAFRGCGLTSITIPNSVTSIGSYAFAHCRELTTFNIPDSVISIDEAAFYNCTSLTSVTIGKSVMSVGKDAFNTCSNLSKINLKSYNISFANDQVFNKCKNLKIVNIYDLYEYAQGNYKNLTYYSSSPELYLNDNKITEIYIPNYITKMCFKYDDLQSLTAVNIQSLESFLNIEFVDSYSNPLRYCGNLYLNGQLVTDLVIPNSVTSIGDYAFYGCSGLTSINISDSVTSIGDYAFYGCSGLTSINIPNSVTSIGDVAFYGCSSLTSINIPDSVTSIGRDIIPISLCTLDSSIYYYGDIMIKAQGGIVTANIPSNIKCIPNSAFYGCTNLTSVTIPDSVTSIGDLAFRGCSKLTSVTIPNNVTSIKNSTFEDCSSLTSVTIPDSVTSIGSYAFDGCSKLTSVTIPDSVTLIRNSAFNSCTSLTTINIPDSVTLIGDYVFHGCSGLTSVTIPDSVTSIGNSAFYSTKITSINIPDSVTSIGNSAFNNCTALKTVNIKSLKSWLNIEFGSSTANPLNNNAKLYLNGELVTDIVIPNEITEIKPHVFYKCSGLSSITIPNSITSIGSYAFNGCLLASITIPNSITSIGSYAFNGCTSLTSVTIPDSVTIDENAFRNCSNITSLTLNDNVTIGPNAFYGCSKLKTLNINGDYCNFTENTWNNVSALKTVNISNISNWATITRTSKKSSSPLYYSAKLYLNGEIITDLVIPEGVTMIGDYAFNANKNITSVTLPTTISYLGSGAFTDCTNITHVNISNLKSYCENINPQTLGSTPLYNTSNLYLNDELLVDLVIPEGTKRIGVGAFYNCNNIKTIYIPDSVETISSSAFRECNNIESVIINVNRNLTIASNAFSDNIANKVAFHKHALRDSTKESLVSFGFEYYKKL